MKNKLKEMLQVTIFPIVYYIGSLRKVSNDILLLDAHNDTCPESLQLLRDKMVEENIKFNERYHNFGKLGFLKSFIASIATVFKVSTYKVIILCDNYLAMDSFDRRPETKIIQVWHGAGAYKKFGYDKNELDISEQDQHKLFRYDYVPVSSNFSAKSFSTAMKLPIENFPVIGVSRTDKLYDQEYIEQTKLSIYTKFPHLKDKKIVLWAPTFRSLESSDSHVGEDEINELMDHLSDDYILIKKLHPHIAKESQYSKYDTSEFMTVADILITDYSSLIFDWMFYKKETQIFIPDYEEYITSNGFYYDPKKLPFPISTTIEELIRNFENITTNDREVLRFHDLMLSGCDGNSTERLVELINQLIAHGDKI